MSTKNTKKKEPRSFFLADKLFWLSIGSILYTYFGYPLIITMLAKTQPKKIFAKESKPKITLLIAAYNEELVIEGKIKNSLKLEYPEDKLQICIVTDGSDDQTPAIVKKYENKGIELLHHPSRRGKMAAINRAIPYTTGDIIVFSDANNFYQPDTIDKLVLPFEDPQIGAVSGAKNIEQDGSSLGASEGFYWKYESFIKEQETRFGSCTGVAGEIFAIRREVFSPAPDNVICDDFYMAMQALKKGYRVVYAPQAKSTERVSVSAKHEIIRRKKIISGRFQAMFMADKILPFNQPVLVWQIISHKFLRPLIPFNMLTAALTNLYALAKSNRKSNKKHSFWSLRSNFGKFTLLGQIIFYFLAWLGGKLEGEDRSNLFMRMIYLPKFLVDSNLAAFQGFIDYIKGQQPHLWERVPRK